MVSESGATHHPSLSSSPPPSPHIPPKAFSSQRIPRRAHTRLFSPLSNFLNRKSTDAEKAESFVAAVLGRCSSSSSSSAASGTEHRLGGFHGFICANFCSTFSLLLQTSHSSSFLPVAAYVEQHLMCSTSHLPSSGCHLLRDSSAFFLFSYFLAASFCCCLLPIFLLLHSFSHFSSSFAHSSSALLFSSVRLL